MVCTLSVTSAYDDVCPYTEIREFLLFGAQKHGFSRGFPINIPTSLRQVLQFGRNDSSHFESGIVFLVPE